MSGLCQFDAYVEMKNDTRISPKLRTKRAISILFGFVPPKMMEQIGDHAQNYVGVCSSMEHYALIRISLLFLWLANDNCRFFTVTIST